MPSIVELRHQNLRNGIDFRQVRCMEIGALTDPVIHKEEGEVLYVDHLSTEALKKQFAWDTTLDWDHLVPIDIVWHKKRLKDCVSGQFDYIFASHVAEHVPDLIGWIKEIQEVLNPKGELRLVLPDGRFSFDQRRQLTRLSDVIASWMKNLRCPDTHIVLDFALNKIADSQVNAERVLTGSLDPQKIESHFSFDDALEWGRRTLNPNHYEDVHCWVLTPRRFAELMIPLVEHDIIQMACSGFVDTAPPGFEFMVFLKPEKNREKRIASWKNLCQEAKDLLAESKQKEILQQQNNQLQQEIDQLRRQLHSLKRSHSWQVTAPLRAITQFFRR